MALTDWLIRDLKRAGERFGNLRLSDVVRQYWRVLRLHRGKAAGSAAPVTAADTSGPGLRVVISLTTIPVRLGHILPTLRSLLDQSEPADRIVLNYPGVSGRTRDAYPDPGALGLPPGVDINRCDDVGPATKLLPTLSAEPDALIIVVDDDVVYPRDFVATLKAAHRRAPDVAWGYRGVTLVPATRYVDLHHVFASAVGEPRDVDVLFGTWGYAVTAAMFDGQVHDFSHASDAVRWADDIWISGHLARRNVARRIPPARSFPVESLAALFGSLSGGVNKSGENDAAAIAHFKADW
ncbi:hypothetical protein CSC94_17615 [Zhengella mangrovi]|uniref:Glycosyltransferase n=1 Tax=Zhengella mangrovi TaxID=1982044 RepID=A0A2G1QJH2_9HYPH|nr:hypothetical protein [Zhengella mangrovi]PHP65666.1 hypothetical protein CSC94_17615 [Zhengella mangrovi]